MTAPRHILVSANSAWNIVNFRMGLVRALQEQGYSVAVAAPADNSALQLEEAGMTFVPLRMSRSGMNPASELSLLRRYLQLMHMMRPAAFLGFTIKPNIYGSLAAQAAGVASINNISGLGTMFLGKRWQAKLTLSLYRLALRRSGTVFFQNPDDRQLFLESGTVRRDQARLLPGSGIDLVRFAPSPARLDKTVFLFIGRLLRDKGVREFVEAARRVRAVLPDVEFELVGGLDPGNRTSIHADELADWVGEGVVRHLGESDDVRPHIARATAVVLPSYREGLPRVLLEAAAMGRPLIATDVPGCRTIVDHRRNGLLCDVRSAGSLADAMIAMARMSQEERDAMGRAARAIVERDYSEAAVVRAYVRALEDIASPSSVGRQ